MDEIKDKRLRTIKKAAQETGSSQSFFKQLVRSGELNKYKINSHRSVYVSLAEFESLAQATK